MGLGLLIARVLIVLVFLAAGGNKIVSRNEPLLLEKSAEYYRLWGQPLLGPSSQLEQNFVLMIGISEVLMAILLVIPSSPLNQLALYGLGVTMVGAFLTHLRLGEYIPGLVAPGILFSIILASIIFADQGHHKKLA